MSDHPVECLKEQDWGKLWEVIKTHTTHVVDGDRQGGYRDRLLMIENEVKILKDRFWWSAAIGGIIGGLVGAGSKDILTIFITYLMGK